MHLIEVAFKGNRKEFFTWEGEEPPPLRAPIIVEADRGEDLGLVNATGDLAQKRNGGCAHGCGGGTPPRKAMRMAGPQEVRQGRDVRAQDDQARQRAAERVKAHGLVMKVSDAEWQWDRKKLTLYFTADRRVDFRNLVRDLASAFRTRIELKQYGVRDEAKRLDGVGRCGRQFCSASWLPELRPVNLGVAKDQHLSLNPSQISGACGRLMCCLRYEHEFYVKSRKRFPKEGKLLKTGRGEEKVVANDIFNERVTLRGADGESRVILLAQLRLELSAQGQPIPGGTQSDGGAALDSLATQDSDRESNEEGQLTAGPDGVIDTADRDSETDDDGDIDSNLFDADWPAFQPAAAAPPRARSEKPSVQSRRSSPPKRPRAIPSPSAAASPVAPSATPSAATPPTSTPSSTPTPGPAATQSPAAPIGTGRSSTGGPASSGGQAAADAPRRRRGRRGGRRGRGGGAGSDGGGGGGGSGGNEGGDGGQGPAAGAGEAGRAPADRDGGSGGAGPGPASPAR